jgi:hypothetical protein
MGGNVFAGTDKIRKEDIGQTLEKYFDELSSIFPTKKEIFKQFKTVGSVGKKPMSGDIDLAVDINLLLDDVSHASIASWGMNPDDVKLIFEKMKKRARTASDESIMQRAFLQQLVYDINDKSDVIIFDEKKVTSGSIFSQCLQYNEHGEQLDKAVQVDWMIGDIEWLEFSYYSEGYEGNVKGLHRTQLVLSLFDSANLLFKHSDGVIDKETKEVLATKPNEAISVLNDVYELSLTKEIICNYFTLRKYLEDNLDKDIYNDVINIYFKILDRTRCDIPYDIQDVWLNKKDTLNLSGKFLPENSNLK